MNIFRISSEFNKYYIKEKITNIKVKKENIKKVRKNSINTFKLKAIISNHILIDNKWYKLNDLVGKYKLTKIEKNLVVLNYKEKNINLRLFKNE